MSHSNWFASLVNFRILTTSRLPNSATIEVWTVNSWSMWSTSLISPHHRVAPLVRVGSEYDHDPDFSSLRGRQGPVGGHASMPGPKVNLLSSHPGRSGAPNEAAKHSTSYTNRGHRYAEPTRRANPKHDTEPFCAVSWIRTRTTSRPVREADLPALWLGRPGSSRQRRAMRLTGPELGR